LTTRITSLDKNSKNFDRIILEESEWLSTETNCFESLKTLMNSWKMFLKKKC